MATFEELQNYVTVIIQQTSLNSLVPGYLNQAVTEITGGMPSRLGSFLTPPLPELFASDTVNTVTDAAYVAMPTNFQRNLILAASSNGNEINLADSMKDFLKNSPALDRSGNIYEVVEFGKNLYYQGIPTASEALTVYYYKTPTEMSATSDEPDGIPEHLQIPLLVNYVAWKIFYYIEDGPDKDNPTQASPNVKKYQQLFHSALLSLELSLPNDGMSINLINDN